MIEQSASSPSREGRGQTVACPVCAAPVGVPCLNMRSMTKVRRTPHPARLRAATAKVCP